MSRAKSNIMSGVNTAVLMNFNLEMSPDLIEDALKAGADGFAIVDNQSSTQPQKREDFRHSDYNQLMETKIIEIDKNTNKYKQVFLYNPGGNNNYNRNIKIHRAFDNYGISNSQVKVRAYRVPRGTSLANIKQSSDIDKISNKTDISSKVKFSTITDPSSGRPVLKLETNSIDSSIGGPVLMEIETNYEENQAIGLGSNYIFNKAGNVNGNNCWLEKSYANEAGVPVVKTTVNHTITFDGNGGKWHMDPVTVEDNKVYDLPGSSFIAPDGKEFDGWMVNGQKKNPGDRITVTSDLTLIAQWRDKAPEQATVSFSPGEGSGTMADVKVNVGSNYQLPDNGFTAPNGKKFDAWSVNGERKIQKTQ